MRITGPRSMLDWYRILRGYYHWPLFEAIRYALWLLTRTAKSGLRVDDQPVHLRRGR
jgi:hypothetical protein